MKLIGNYTSPYVRKISVILLEKGLTFEFVNVNPWVDDSPAPQFNPLGKVPTLITDEGEQWFDSPIIAQYLELLDLAPEIIPHDPKAALKVRQLEALSDGILDAALTSVREKFRPPEQQSEEILVRQREKISRALDMLEQYAADGTLTAEPLNLASISAACAVGYLNFRRVSPGWCVNRPHLVKLVEKLFLRESFARTEPPAA
ncbi:glutathione S-transferase [Cedecea davisae]|uniref:glutathione S-transferase n=1 Tax=Cedecea davisae TaxID=158484 RepID=UPI00242B70BB|nr:glutathione S-transferase [Cedecea davisae]